jgi:transposase
MAVWDRDPIGAYRAYHTSRALGVRAVTACGDSGTGTVLIGVPVDHVGRGLVTAEDPPQPAARFSLPHRIRPHPGAEWVARYRERHCTSGAKSDAGDAHTLAIWCTWMPIRFARWPGTPRWWRVKVLARTHQSLIWDRQRKLLRLRAALREFFLAALATFPDLTAVDAVELLAAASDPAMAPGLSRARIAGALTRAWRRDVAATVAVISTFNA